MCELAINTGETITHCNQIDCERALDDIYEELKGKVEVSCSHVPSYFPLINLKEIFES